MEKVAVVLFNLGGPDSKKSIRPFLFNFFMDPNIVRLALPFRFLLACLIAIKRSGNEAGKSYGLLGNKSPLLKNSQAQAAALEKTLGPGFKVFVCMRYWHPLAKAVVQKVKNWGPDKIILLPLYPQFSTTTTRSALQSWHKAAAEAGLRAPTAGTCCYPVNDGFIKASVENIRAVYERAKTKGIAQPRLLFSAHGLPELIIADGDPYQWQCEEGARKIVTALDMPDLDWKICYQSRVGAQKWIGPSTGEEIRRAAADKIPVVIYPHAFTQEHVETLVEIEIEYRALGKELGVPAFARVPTVSTHPAFIEGLAQLVRERLDKTSIAADGGKRICPPEFPRCCMERAV